MADMVKRTERGWPGHFILSHRCLFRRNTLLEYGELKIVISTVGLLLQHDYEKRKGWDRFDTVGMNRYFETMAFYAEMQNGFIDSNGDWINFDSPWMLESVADEDKADAMHETVVREISRKLKQGFYDRRNNG